jgi:hypothetical protein
MIAGTYNIYCEQGATFTRVLTVLVPDEVDPEITTPYDLANHTARMQVRRTIDSATRMVELTTQNGGLTIDDESGSITIQMADEVTASLTSSGVYDLEIIDSIGRVSRVVQGTFMLNPEVTR